MRMSDEEFLALSDLVRNEIHYRLELYMRGVNVKHFLHKPITQKTLYDIGDWVYWGVIQQFNSDWFVSKAFLRGMEPPFHITVKAKELYGEVDILLEMPQKHWTDESC